jgi:hypothetical protein
MVMVVEPSAAELKKNGKINTMKKAVAEMRSEAPAPARKPRAKKAAKAKTKAKKTKGTRKARS